MRILSVLAFMTCLIACTTGTQPASEKTGDYKFIRFDDLRATQAERTLCETAGGTVVMTGLAGGDHCVQSLPDAGKACSDVKDCLGRCIMESEPTGMEFGTKVTGVCEATDNIFGCTPLVENGEYAGTLCVD